MSENLQATAPAAEEEVAPQPRVRVVPLRPVGVEEAGPRVAEEQLAYARVLDAGMKIGLLSLVLTFGVYLTGTLAPRIPVDDLPRYWSLPVKQYLAAAGVDAGWGWLRLVGSGDFLNFVGIAFLSSVAALCYAAITPIFFRRKDTIYAWLAVVEVLVLALAASGLLQGGGH